MKYSPFIINVFPSIVKACFAEIIKDALLDEKGYEELRAHLRRLDIACEVTWVEWSKFHFVRNSLSLDRQLLLADPVHLERVIATAADNLACLLRREAKEGDEDILARLSADQLRFCINTLWVNEMSARMLTRHILDQAIRQDTARWAQVEKIIDSLGRN